MKGPRRRLRDTGKLHALALPLSRICSIYGGTKPSDRSLCYAAPKATLGAGPDLDPHLLPRSHALVYFVIFTL